MPQTYEFTCSECTAEVTVDVAIRDELLASGCLQAEQAECLGA